MNIRSVFNVVGILLILLAGVMCIPIGVSLYFSDPPVQEGLSEVKAFLITFFLSGSSGLILWKSLPPSIEKLRDREGFAIVGISWIFITLFGALPFYLTDSCPSFVDAYFESMSGFTTTGASVLTNIDSLPHGILFWRNLMQWMGGMGIIMLSLAIFPALGIGSFHLFKAEIPGGSTVERMQPRLAETAKLLWKTYVSLTLIEIALLVAGGLTPFDAICHAFSTVATGGFSPHQESIGFFDNAYVETVVTVFMFLGGVNFALLYHVVHRNFKAVFTHPEFRVYGISILIGVSLTTWGLWYQEPQGGVIPAFRSAAFNVVSIHTTTGYATEDFNLWPDYLRIFLVVLMMIGACSGSTSGSLKIIRFIILFKIIFRELQKLIHPRAIIRIKVGQKPLDPDDAMNVVALTGLFVGFSTLSVLLLSLMGLGLTEATTASVATLFNIGPGLGSVGPEGHYADVPAMGKWMLILWMLMGRLEIFGILLLFTPMAWRK